MKYYGLDDLSFIWRLFLPMFLLPVLLAIYAWLEGWQALFFMPISFCAQGIGLGFGIPWHLLDQDRRRQTPRSFILMLLVIAIGSPIAGIVVYFDNFVWH